jgi:ATP phosphoribosyltransferase
MTGRLIIGVPSKGRLQENATAFFARAGLILTQEGGARDYRGQLRDLPGAQILFLSASEIVAKLASGDAHLGVTGEDLIRESVPDADRRINLLAPLGFGQANVVVAVPKGWIDASTMEDLEEIAADFHARHGRRMRVATKYVNLTRRFFAENGVADYRIVESLGATEGAPASGTAEFIVDITTTGSTLEANALKVLDDGVMLRSQANLAASMQADWNAETLSLARIVLGRISAEQAARTTRMLNVATGGGTMDRFRLLLAGHPSAIMRASGDDRITVRCPADDASALASALIGAGAADVEILRTDYVFSQHSPLFEALERGLAGRSDVA